MLILIFDSYILILSEIEGIKSILQDYNPEKKDVWIYMPVPCNTNQH